MLIDKVSIASAGLMGSRLRLDVTLWSCVFYVHPLSHRSRLFPISPLSFSFSLTTSARLRGDGKGVVGLSRRCRKGVNRGEFATSSAHRKLIASQDLRRTHGLRLPRRLVSRPPHSYSRKPSPTTSTRPSPPILHPLPPPTRQRLLPRHFLFQLPRTRYGPRPRSRGMAFSSSRGRWNQHVWSQCGRLGRGRHERRRRRGDGEPGGYSDRTGRMGRPSAAVPPLHHFEHDRHFFSDAPERSVRRMAEPFGWRQKVVVDQEDGRPAAVEY